MNGAEVILDTNVVSYLMRGGPLAEAYAPHVQNRLLAITFVTIGELYFGAEKGKWEERKRRELEAALHNFVVIPYDHRDCPLLRSVGGGTATKRKADRIQRRLDCRMRGSPRCFPDNA